MMYEQPYHNANGATDSSQTFELSITTTEGGLEQNIQGIDLNDSTKVDLYENRVALEGEATPYDGLWVLTSRNEIEEFEGEWQITYTMVGSDMLQQSYMNADSTEVIQNYKRL